MLDGRVKYETLSQGSRAASTISRDAMSRTGGSRAANNRSTIRVESDYHLKKIEEEIHEVLRHEVSRDFPSLEPDIEEMSMSFDDLAKPTFDSEPDGFYIIQKGQCEVRHRGDDFIVATLFRDHYFGEGKAM